MIAPLVIHGRIVTMDRDRAVIEDGALYVGADERFHGVQARGDTAPAGFDEARHVETKGCIYPGLIDLHSHVVYNVLPLAVIGGTTAIQGSAKMAYKAHLKYCEVKARR